MKFIFISLLFFTSLGFAQAVNQNTTTVTEKESFWQKNKVIGGLKSFNVIGRGREMDEVSGRRFKSKNEMFLGLKNQSGWGVQGMIVETAQVKGVSSKNTFGPADPSVTLMHPIMETANFKMTGAFRQYFPVSDLSVSNNLWQQAYYLNTTWKLKNKIELFNQAIPRYFSQSKYKSTDTTFYTEDYTTLTKVIHPKVRLGMGQHSQVEVHQETATGFVADIYPLMDVMITPTVYFGPRVYFPILASGSVYDAARSVSLNEAQVEFYLNATL
jgi:hypothetical protein